jgi:hypothetical protein
MSKPAKQPPPYAMVFPGRNHLICKLERPRCDRVGLEYREREHVTSVRVGDEPQVRRCAFLHLRPRKRELARTHADGARRGEAQRGEVLDLQGIRTCVTRVRL